MMEHKRGIYNTNKSAAFRKKLRKALTPAEAVLWKCLQRRQLLDKKFRRQFSIFEINVDAYEADRTKYLESCGIRVKRFENKVVFDNLEAVLETIKMAITETAVPSRPPRLRR